MNTLLEPFAYGYMTNAIWVSALVGAVCAFLSAYLMLTNITGPELWMKSVNEVQADTIRRCKAWKDEFEALKLVSYPGQNVKSYCKDAQELLMNLQREGALPPDHLTTILDVFCSCTVPDFNVQWMVARKDLESFVHLSNFKDKKLWPQIPGYTTYVKLLEEGKMSYNNLQKSWGPALAIAEAKTAATPNSDTMKKLDAKIQSLVAKGVSQKLKAALDGVVPPAGAANPKHKNLTCHNCNQKGHIKPNCPQLKGGNGGKSSKGGGNNNGGQQQGKWTAPKDGESHTKTIDGKTYYYCSKCNKGKGRWTKHHLTEAHRNDMHKGASDGGSGGGSGGGSLQPAGNIGGINLNDLSSEAVDNLKNWLSLH